MERPNIPGFDWGTFDALAGRHPQQGFMRDWRMEQRPTGDNGAALQQFNGQWQQLRNYAHSLRGPMSGPSGGQPAPAATPVQQPMQTTPAQPQVMPYVAPVLPQGPGGVGSSYALQGLNPAASGFGLPRY